MHRNSYDTDITTWSPVGRLHQVEYAMEAVKQGSATVGVKSKDTAVLVSLKRAPHSELSSYQKKIFKVDSHMAVGVAGLTADGRLLCKYMRNECMNHRFIFEAPMQVSRLVLKVADKSQVCTQKAGKRPFGVGLLVAGADKTGVHLFQTCPSGNYYDYKAVAIGARSQSAKTYLEDNFESFENASEEELVVHALKALSKTLGENVDLNTNNCTVCVVGAHSNVEIYEDEMVDRYLNLLPAEEPASASSSEPAAEDMVVD